MVRDAQIILWYVFVNPMYNNAARAQLAEAIEVYSFSIPVF